MMKGPENSTQLGAGWDAAAQTMQKPAMVRALTIARLMTTKAALLVFIGGVAQLILPAGHRPSDLIGSFHGNLDNSDILAKRETLIAFERDKAKAVAREQAKVQWEAEVLRQQMQTLSDSETAQSTQANGADWLCVFGKMIPSNVGDPDWRNAGQAMRGACGVSDEIRANQQKQYADLARRYQALVSRSDELGDQITRSK